ncbi:DUF6228 family protein [Streptomyces erythrochromogenes]|uniref:DUF6228 family protein n=1 Tax=Streptomyces erythrochromogenes TaxID=285574 RepID=UPI0037010D87
MIPQDDDFDERPHVAIRCQDNESVRVGFHDRRSSDGHCVHYCVAVEAPGMRARLDDAVAWIGDGGDLAPFLEGLAADFTGWDGERCWQTNDRDLAVSAVFRSGGYIALTWTLRPWRHDAGGWGASVTTRLEAGEQMASLAADLRHFLEDGATR